MLIQNYDPASIKLFSKCARDHASRLNPRKRPPTAHPQSQLRKKLRPEEQSNKNKPTLCSFDMAESREQRASKFQVPKTPAVGQYNPKLEWRPKLTWDILKVYRNRTQSRNIMNKVNHSPHKPQIEAPQQQNLITQTLEEHPAINNPISQPSPDQNTLQYHTLGKKSHRYNRSKKGSDVRQYSTSSKHTISPGSRTKMQVNMSRMVGRSSAKCHTGGSEQIGDESFSNFDLNKSIDTIKCKVSRNVDFSKQLSRDKVSPSKKNFIGPSNYHYDINLIKPKASALVDYSRLKGRDRREGNSQTIYSYTHYQYDEFVWKGKSNVYRNTKSGVIDFNKERGRH